MGLHFYKTLLSWRRTGTLAENAIQRSDVVRIDKCFQVHELWTTLPYNAEGKIENATISIIVDDKFVESVRIDARFAPPFYRNAQIAVIPFGNRKSVDPVENTCLKGAKNLRVEVTAGPGSVTGDMKMILKGDWFEDDAAMVAFFKSTMFNPTPVSVVDPFRGITFMIHRPTPINAAKWKDAAGGSVEAPKPRVLPLVKPVRNESATTINVDYEFDARIAGRIDPNRPWEDTYFDATDRKTAFWLRYIGCETHPNALNAYYKIGGDEYPKDRWNIQYYQNELPLGIADRDFKGPLPVYQQMMLLVYGETAVLGFRDNGTSVPADGVLFGLWGKLFELV